MNRFELANAIIQADKTINVSNIKFYKLLISRLTEYDGITYDDAVIIASNMVFDFSNVPEDNDTLPQIATELAEYCYKIFKFMKLNGIKNIAPIVKYFQPPFKLEVDSV